MFRDSRGRYKSGPIHIITAELVAGLNTTEFKTQVATALDMKGVLEGAPGSRVLGRARNNGGLGNC